MSQGSQTAQVESSEKKAGGDADRFLNIIVLRLFLPIARLRETKINAENNDQIRRCFKKVFLPVHAERRERCQSFRRYAVFVTFALLRLRCLADSTLDSRAADLLA